MFRDIPRTSSLTWRLLTFALLLFLLVERAWDRIIKADLWGEDGVWFVAQALSHGPRSLLIPENGSYFTIERLIVLGSLHAPLAFVPNVITVASLILLAAVMSRFVSDDYEWLVPGRSLRGAAACLFCLLPGLREMAGNACNLNWILFCWLAFVALKDPSRAITPVEILLIPLVALSMGTAVLIVPIFGWRLWRSRQSDSPGTVWRRDALALALVIVCGVAVPVLFPGDRPTGAPFDSWWSVARAWYSHIARVGFFVLIFGDRLTPYLWFHFHTLALAVSLLVAGMVSWLWWLHRYNPRIQAAGLLFVCLSGWVFLAVLRRPYALFLFAWDYPFMMRYSFIMMFAGLVCCLIALSSPGWSRRSQQLAFCFIALNGLLVLHRFNIDAYGAEALWQSSVSELEQALATGCPQSVTIRQYPDDLSFSYSAPARSSCP